MDSVSYLLFLFLFTANPDQLCVCVDAVDVIVLGGCCLGRNARAAPDAAKAAPRWPELRQTVPAPTAARAEAERRQSCARQCAAEGDL